MSQYGAVTCCVCGKTLYEGTDLIGEISRELKDTHEDKILKSRYSFYCLDHYMDNEKDVIR